MSQLETPILFLIFNRPAETAQVFNSIRAQRPKRLFVAADGAREGRAGETELVQQTRQIATQVDWPCDVQTLFREKNLGCGLAVSGAITWFFDHVEEGIILEDDCLPHADFYPFCTTLLERHRHDDQIATIAGTHFLPTALPHRGTHYVSKYFQMWGWASWRRVWKCYDYQLAQRSEPEWHALCDEVHPGRVESAYWKQIYHSLKADVIDTWDFQVFFAAWHTQAHHIMPSTNLVSNLGYGPNATHTNFASNMANLPTFPLKIGNHATPLAPDSEVDNLVFYLRFLDSLSQTWWLEQILCPEQRLAEVRTELQRKERYIRQLELEVTGKRRQLLAATKALAVAATSNSRQDSL
jgi:hypothetical protein